MSSFNIEEIEPYGEILEITPEDLRDKPKFRCTLNNIILSTLSYPVLPGKDLLDTSYTLAYIDDLEFSALSVYRLGISVNAQSVENGYYEYVDSVLSYNYISTGSNNSLYIYNISTREGSQRKGRAGTLINKLKYLMNDGDTLTTYIRYENSRYTDLCRFFIKRGFIDIGMENRDHASGVFFTYPMVSLTYTKGTQEPNEYMIESSMNACMDAKDTYYITNNFINYTVVIDKATTDILYGLVDNSPGQEQQTELGGYMNAYSSRIIEGRPHERITELKVAIPKGEIKIGDYNTMTVHMGTPRYPSILQWHTHPHSCYLYGGCYIMWPSSPDTIAPLALVSQGTLISLISSYEHNYCLMVNPYFLNLANNEVYPKGFIDIFAGALYSLILEKEVERAIGTSSRPQDPRFQDVSELHFIDSKDKQARIDRYNALMKCMTVRIVLDWIINKSTIPYDNIGENVTGITYQEARLESARLYSYLEDEAPHLLDVEVFDMRIPISNPSYDTHIDFVSIDRSPFNQGNVVIPDAESVNFGDGIHYYKDIITSMSQI